MRKNTSDVFLARVLKFHQPKYQHPAEGERVDPDRLPICTGCEVFWWPCPTVKLADGTWESVPT